MSSGPETATRWLTETEMRFWRTFVITATLVDARLNRELVEAHGISHADYVILVVLSEAPGERMRMTALAEITASSKSRLSHQVARMERDGLVRREECSDDGRGILAVLLPRGRRLLEEAAPTHVEGVRRHVVDRITADEQRTFVLALQRVLEGLRPPEVEVRAS